MQKENGSIFIFGGNKSYFSEQFYFKYIFYSYFNICAEGLSIIIDGL